MDCIVHGVAKSQTQLSDFHFIYICISQAHIHTLSMPEDSNTKERVNLMWKLPV